MYRYRYSATVGGSIGRYPSQRGPLMSERWSGYPFSVVPICCDRNTDYGFTQSVTLSPHSSLSNGRYWNGRSAKHSLRHVSNEERIGEIAAVSSDHDRVEIRGSPDDRLRGMTHLHDRVDLGVVFGGHYLGLVKHLRGVLLGLFLDVVSD